MKNLNLSLALLLALSALSSLPALAENEQKDLAGRITSTGFDPYQKVIATSNNAEVSRNVSANACGFVKISPTDSFPIEDGDDIGINGVNYELKPGVCIVVEPGEVHEVTNTGNTDLILTYFGLRTP